jgi:hypothetical protein
MNISREQYFSLIDPIVNSPVDLTLRRAIEEDDILNALTPDLAEISRLDQITEHFREELGGRLNNKVKLASLKFDFRAPRSERDKVPTPIRRGYGRSLAPAARVFGTVEKLRSATLEEIKAVAGISDYHASFLFNGFRPLDHEIQRELETKPDLLKTA